MKYVEQKLTRVLILFYLFEIIAKIFVKKKKKRKETPNDRVYCTMLNENDDKLNKRANKKQAMKEKRIKEETREGGEGASVSRCLI